MTASGQAFSILQAVDRIGSLVVPVLHPDPGINGSEIGISRRVTGSWKIE